MPVDEEIVEAAPAEGVTESTESATGEQQEPQEGDRPKPQGGFQKRIDKLTRSNSQLEQEKEYWRQQALRTAPVETKTATPEAKEPSEDDFDTHAAYVKALATHTAKQILESERASQRTESAKTEQQKTLDTFKARQEAFRAEHDDFDDVIEDAPSITLTPAFQATIIESEFGPELQYYLAKNPAELERLNALSPLNVARELGKIESRFTSSQPEKVVNVTKAPAPISPVGRATKTSQSLEDADSYTEFEARRNAQLAART